MTYREKMLEEHPGRVNEGAHGGVYGCPPDNPCGRYGRVERVSYEDCERCWEREVTDDA